MVIGCEGWFVLCNVYCWLMGGGVGLFVVDALSVVDDGRMLQLENDDDDVVANGNGQDGNG